MNHCVPEFDIEDDYDDSIPPTTTTSSALHRSKESTAEEEEEQVMELLWENGEVVRRSQSQRSVRKKSASSEIIISSSSRRRSQEEEEEEEEETTNNNANHHHHHHHRRRQLLIQEDEMSSWLHYPLDDSDFYADLLYAPPVLQTLPPPPCLSVAPPRPPLVPSQHRQQQLNYHNFSLFSRPRRINESGPSNSNNTAKDSTDTPRVSCAADNVGGGGNVGCSFTATNFEVTVSSSAGGLGASVTAAASKELRNQFTTSTLVATAEEDRKRKGREADDSECQSEDVEFESANAKKQVHGSTSSKRSRAAEVHNLSERRRRDRINEKMKALQELIPRCNKSDKASMLDEAIEYLKSLQMQVQMMSMGCGMVPMMFPGVHQYMPPMGMGMGMGMSMDMVMNRPMMPFSPVLPGSMLQNTTAASHMVPRFPMSGFHMPPVSIPDPSRIQSTSQQSDLMLNSFASHNLNQALVSNCADPYRQYLGLHQAQVPLPQNQAVQPSPSRPNSSREGGNPDDRPSN